MGDDALGDSSGWYSQRHSRSRAPSVKKKTETWYVQVKQMKKMYMLLTNHFQIRPRKHVMGVRWNTLVKILGLLKWFKFHFQLNLIKNKEWKQLSILKTEHKVYNLIKIDALIQVVPPHLLLCLFFFFFFLLSECVHDELKADNVTCV